MIKVNIRKPAQAAGINNAHQLQQATGLSVSGCYALWSENLERIEIHTTLDVLCKTLGCDTQTILTFKSTKKR